MRSSVRQMLKSGMHYGEKAIKCNARMKQYVWMKKTLSNSTGFGYNSGFTNYTSLLPSEQLPFGSTRMQNSYFKQEGSQHDLLLSSDTGNVPSLLGGNTEFNNGVTSGSLANLSDSAGQYFPATTFKSRENLRSKSVTIARPLIKKGRNIINLLKTRRCLNKALAQLTKYAAKGKTFLFVGTKKAAAGLVSRAALFSKKAFFVNTRWLGGMLTNWKTILKSISKIRPILKEKQIIIKDILEKRQNIKARLIQKALLLRKKSRFILKKGRLLIQILKNTSSSFLGVTEGINTKRKDLVSKGIVLLEKQKQLILKQNTLVSQILVLKSNKTTLTKTYEKLLNNLLVLRSKVRELKAY